MGTKALARNKTNYLVWVSHILFTLFGTPFICLQWGSISDVEMPSTQEKGSHLPPGTTKLGNLSDSRDLSQLPLPNQISDSSPLCFAESPPWDARNVTGHTEMLGELVGSDTKIAIYPTYAISCKRLSSVPCSIPGSRGCR